MKYEGYYPIIFVFIGFVLILLYYYNIQKQQQQSINNINCNYHSNKCNQGNQGNQGDRCDTSIKYNKYNVDDDHIKLYKDPANYKKTNNLNNINNYTYNIDNIDILKDNNNFNNDSKLGNKNLSTYEKELEDVYNSTLRGNINDTNEPDEIFNYSVKPNKTDLPIINPPLQLLQSNAPLRLSERHISFD
jgi:hypothetical protein